MVFNFINLVLEKYWKSMENDFFKCMGIRKHSSYMWAITWMYLIAVDQSKNCWLSEPVKWMTVCLPIALS